MHIIKYICKAQTFTEKLFYSYKRFIQHDNIKSYIYFQQPYSNLPGIVFQFYVEFFPN